MASPTRLVPQRGAIYDRGDRVPDPRSFRLSVAERFPPVSETWPLRH